MSSKLLDAATKLSEPERILLVEQIWDSLAVRQSGPTLTAAQTTELDRRLTRLEKTGSTGSSWDQVKMRLKAKRVR